MPHFLYGTAWKEDETERLTLLAIEQGFRGIDTANQRKHYFEAAVGRGIQAAIQRGLVRREELFLQTKFTFQAGQDHRLPYDPVAPIATQVEQSCSSSLEHLGIEQIDSYLLHGPSQRGTLGPADWDAWRAMETLHERGVVKALGISNVSLDQLEALCYDARVKPSYVQNRCYASQAWDWNVRQFCMQHHIIYQGFSLLTANRAILQHPALVEIAKRYQRTVCQIIFRFAIDIGMLPLTGTTSEKHMQEDLAVKEFELTKEEARVIEEIATTKL
jgi:diketogulonate reductase-like aldo/keto reductase